MADVFICDGVRTPIGRYGGSLSSVRPDDLAASSIKALMERNPAVDWAAVDDVMIGCANQAGEDNRNVARIHRFRWPASNGMGGRFHRNTQPITLSVQLGDLAWFDSELFGRLGNELFSYW